MDPLEELLEEHIIIMKMIGVLNEAKGNLQTGKKIPEEFFDKTIDMIKNFADRCHHGKEETALFPLITKRNTEERETVSLFSEEHDQGRDYIRSLSEAAEKDETNHIVESIDGYTKLLTQHIGRENVVFRKWINPLSEKEKEEISEKFEEIEEKEIGFGKHQEYIQKIETLKKSLI